MLSISVCCKAVRDCIANQLIKHPNPGMDALWYRFVHLYIYIYIFTVACSWLALSALVRAVGTSEYIAACGLLVNPGLTPAGDPARSSDIALEMREGGLARWTPKKRSP